MALTTSTAKAVLAKREALAIAEQELAQARREALGVEVQAAVIP